MIISCCVRFPRTFDVTRTQLYIEVLAQLSDFSVTLSGTGAKPVTLTANFSHLRNSSSSKARATPSSSSAGGSGVDAGVDSDMPVHRMAAKAYIKELQDDEG